MGVRVLKVQRKDMKISIAVNETKLTVTIFDSPSARDFLSMLPLNLALENYTSNEKICHLPRKLTTSGSGTFANEAISTTGLIGIRMASLGSANWTMIWRQCWQTVCQASASRATLIFPAGDRQWFRIHFGCCNS